MAKVIQKLSARRVATETRLGPHGDGGNLFLIVKKTKRGTLSRRWSFIYYVNRRRRELGLGSSVLVSLGQARKLPILYEGRKTEWSINEAEIDILFDRWFVEARLRGTGGRLV